MGPKNPASFFVKSFTDFLEGLFNLFVFFPYFFSINTLFKTLFSPWKNLVSKKTSVGFSFEDWFSRLSFDLISRGLVVKSIIHQLTLLPIYLTTLL